MDVYINQLKRIIDRIIMPQFPEIVSYRVDVKEKNGFHYLAVLYEPEKILSYDNFSNAKDDMWKNIVTQTKRYYEATGHDEHYQLAAIGEVREFVSTPEPGSPPPIKWWWRLNNEEGWQDRRDRTAQFYMHRRSGVV